MANMTKADLIGEIDFERRERNAKFIDPDQTARLMDRAIDRILREPGVRTVPKFFQFTAQNGIIDIQMPDDFKELMQIMSGEGTTTVLPFEYKPLDEFNTTIVGYVYTFDRKRGYISLKFPDTLSLPTTTISAYYWGKNIILDQDGVTEKRKWENDDDTSLLPEEYDDFYIMWPVSKIMSREGKTADAAAYKADAIETLEMLKERPGSKTDRPRRSFGIG